MVRLLEWKPLVMVGLASYSIYVWHGPILELVTREANGPDSFLPLLAVILPLVIAWALLSYRVVEEPALRLRRRWAGAAAPAPPRAGSRARS
jgi:peptidoglycan/LPS O-acetylase OafA/YrhL